MVRKRSPRPPLRTRRRTIRRWLRLPIAAALLWLLPAAQAQADLSGPTVPKPIPARAAIGSGPFYVGQTIPVQVVTVAGGNRPAIEPPQVPGATLALAGSGMQPLSVSAIGDFALNESNAFTFVYRLVPTRAGTLTIPPFVVTDGSRRGTTRTLRVEVRDPPLAGRPHTFRGGVGPLTARAEAVPDAVRVGQPFEFRVRVEGPGARGTTGLGAEVVERLEALPIAPVVTELPAESGGSVPARVFRHRVRPTRPGMLSLPPVLLSWFDPGTTRYQTVATASVPVRVVDVPRLDAARLDYGPAEDSTTHPALDWSALADRLRRARTSAWFWATWWLPLAAALLGWAWIQGRRRTAPARQAARTLERALRNGSTDEPGAVALRVVSSLTDYLGHSAGWPGGTMTPAEARRLMESATGRPDLGTAAARLVAQCDRVRFAPDGADVGSVGLLADARDLFAALSSRRAE